MKKLLTLTAACALFTAPATAVQKCVALDVNAGMTANGDHHGAHTDWYQVLDNGVMVRGVGACARDTAETFGSVFNSEIGLNTVATTDQSINKNCWCKMTSPVESRWVYVLALADHTTCLDSCASWCWTTFTSSPEFRSALFNNLRD